MVELRNAPLVSVNLCRIYATGLSLVTVIRVESERQLLKQHFIEVQTETRYYIASFSDTAQAFAERIRGYWGVENKVHYVP